ncbi:MAG: hypothetical protein RL701_1952 [Pseudomonadota bacterium]
MLLQPGCAKERCADTRRYAAQRCIGSFGLIAAVACTTYAHGLTLA